MRNTVWENPHRTWEWVPGRKMSDLSQLFSDKQELGRRFSRVSRLLRQE